VDSSRYFVVKVSPRPAFNEYFGKAASREELKMKGCLWFDLHTFHTGLWSGSIQFKRRGWPLVCGV
jgi:hypothetical protein